MSEANQKLDWWENPPTIKKIIYGLYTVCALLVLADFFYHKHPYFDLEKLIGFYGFYGFLGSVGLVMASKLLRRVIMRPEDYYTQEYDSDEAQGEEGESA